MENREKSTQIEKDELMNRIKPSSIRPSRSICGVRSITPSANSIQHPNQENESQDEQ